MQNLLLDTYTEVDAFNRAKKLHIATSVKRAVFLVETKQAKDENAPGYHKEHLFFRTKDFITAIDDSGIIIIRELSSTESYDSLEALLLCWVDMLNTEAMTSAWVAYSRIAEDLKDFPVRIKRRAWL